MATDFQKAMVAWAKELATWILEHPDRDWLQELCDLKNGATATGSTGGDHPPVPPPIP